MPSQVGTARRPGGPSVMRFYKYLAAGRGSGCHAHADLGLLTLSPAPTCPGLLVYDREGLEWYEAEGEMGKGITFPQPSILFHHSSHAILQFQSHQSNHLIPHLLGCPPREVSKSLLIHRWAPK